MDPGAVELSVEFAGLTLRNPLVAASGTAGWGDELERIEGFSNELLGATVLKSTTLEPRLGSRTPRIVETAGGAGIINAIGLENPGVEAVVAEYIPRLADCGTVVIANAAGSTIDEYAQVAERLCACEVVAACEVNISCPNVKRGGLAFGTDPCTAGEVIAAVRKVTAKPIIAKLTPNVTDVAAIARSCIDAGAHALSLTNTFRALAIDIRTHRPIIANNVGGLSGPAIKPLSLLKVHEAYGVAREAGGSILGGGGIVCGADALEFALAGSTAIFVGTLLLRQPGACAMLLEEMKRLLAEQGVGTFAELVGKLELHD